MHDEPHSSHDAQEPGSKSDFSRRLFMATTLATGFAAAVQPVSAETITTDAEGLEAGEVKIPVADGEMPAYRARPAQGEMFPTVLVIQEIFGVHEHIKDICRRFAKQGYLAIAPELYMRQGSVAGLTDIGEIIGKVVSKVPDSQVMADLDATAEWARKEGKGHGEKAGRDRLLLGWADYLAVFSTQRCAEGRCCLVWPNLHADGRTASQEPDRLSFVASSARTRTLRRARRWNSARHSRRNAGRIEEGKQAVRDRRLP